VLYELPHQDNRCTAAPASVFVRDNTQQTTRNDFVDSHAYQARPRDDQRYTDVARPGWQEVLFKIDG
jgi:hypothetical protein